MKTDIDTVSRVYELLEPHGLEGLLIGSQQGETAEVLKKMIKGKVLKPFIALVTGKPEEDCNLPYTEAMLVFRDFFIELAGGSNAATTG